MYICLKLTALNSNVRCFFSKICRMLKKASWHLLVSNEVIVDYDMTWNPRFRFLNFLYQKYAVFLF